MVIGSYCSNLILFISSFLACSKSSVFQLGKMWSPDESVPQPEGHRSRSKGEGTQPPAVVKANTRWHSHATNVLRAAVSRNTYRSYPSTRQRRQAFHSACVKFCFTRNSSFLYLYLVGCWSVGRVDALDF